MTGPGAEIDLDAFQAICDAASPEPWEPSSWPDAVIAPARKDFPQWLLEEHLRIWGGPRIMQSLDVRDREFVMAARTVAPTLLAEVRRLREELHEAREPRSQPCR